MPKKKPLPSEDGTATVNASPKLRIVWRRFIGSRRCDVHLDEQVEMVSRSDFAPLETEAVCQQCWEERNG